MSNRKSSTKGLVFHPLTPDRWDDLERLFGPRGAYGGCWCMWWRTKRAEFEANQNEGNKRAFKALVDSEEVPGILAYRKRMPIGWCSVAPREQYGSLERSPVLRRVDNEPVWSIVCFFIAPEEQGQGVARALLRAALEYVRTSGGHIVEAYPTRPRGRKLPPVSSFMGVPSLFESVGFKTVAEPSAARLIMRKNL